MKILFDHGTPAPLRGLLADHIVITAYEMGWAELDNGDLLEVAENAFDAPSTTDQNPRFQQNITGRKLAILVLPTTSWPRIQRYGSQVAAAVDALKPGNFVELSFSQ